MAIIVRVCLCRQRGCTPEGNFFGRNRDWISTEGAGGWRWACPACGSLYKATLVGKPGLIPASRVLYLEKMGLAMLAEWSERLDAFQIAELATSLRFTELSTEDVQLKLGELVASHGMKADFSIQCVEELNAYRGNWSYRHIEKGDIGGFFK